MQFNDLLKDCLVNVCRNHGPYQGLVSVDAIIYISSADNQHAVIKVREAFEAPVVSDVKNICDNLPENFNDVKSNYSEDELSEKFIGDRDDSVPIENQLIKCLNDSIPARNHDSGERVGELFRNESISLQNLCKLCEISFSSKEEYFEHNKVKHKFYTCTICLKTFTSRSNMQRHFRMHTGQKPYVCTVCQRCFARKDHLANHLSKHAFRCNLCFYKNPNSLNLTSHFILAHNLPLTSICRLCKTGFSNGSDFKDHFKTHWAFQVLQNSKNNLCNTSLLKLKEPDLNDKGFGDNHLNNKNTANYSALMNLSTDFKKLFPEEPPFSSHLTTNEETIEAASYLKVLQYNSLTENLKNVSQLRKEDYLGKSEYMKKNEAPSNNNVENYQVRRNRDDDKLKRNNENPENEMKYENEEGSMQPLNLKIKNIQEFKCVDDHADGVEMSSEGLEEVREACPNGDIMQATHPCSLCGEGFQAFQNLDVHTATVHKRRPCFYCSKTFAQKANRDRHHCLHTGRKPYACSFCEQGFPRGDKLKMHLAKVHQVVTPSKNKISPSFDNILQPSSNNFC